MVEGAVSGILSRRFYLMAEHMAVPETKDLVPQHVAIIMDGNGRWAQQRGKRRTAGHKAGAEAVRNAVAFARKTGIQSLTLFAFSSENWKRPKEEVSVLMELFLTVLQREVKKLHKHGVQLRIIGDIAQFSPRLQQRIRDAELLTVDNRSLTLNIAANYGGRWDITQATKAVANAVQQGDLQITDINEQVLAEHMQLADQPTPDLLIRTGGERRISNFLLWQLAYAEFYFAEVLWPDFSAEHFAAAIADYATRERRFGLTSQQIHSMMMDLNGLTED